MGRSKKRTRNKLPLMDKLINDQNAILAGLYRDKLLAYQSEAVNKIEQELIRYGVPHQRERVVSINLTRSRKRPEMKTYFLDFFFKEMKLIVEVDGGYHTTEDQRKKDSYRDTLLKDRKGWRTLRLTNEEVMAPDFSLIRRPDFPLHHKANYLTKPA